MHPCDFKGWRKIAVKTGIDMVNNEKIHAILSVGSPWTDHLVSRDISRATGVKWIASYMDPWTQAPNPDKWKRKFSWKWFISRFIGRLVEKNICGSAYCAVHNSEPWAKELEKILKINVYPVPHGTDQSDFKDLEEVDPNAECLTISYVGTLHFTEKTDVFFEGFAKFILENNIPSDKLKFKLIGCDSMKLRYKKFEEIEKYIENIPYVPRADAQKYIMQSHILLLFMIDDDGWYPMKCFDYLGVNAQILATPRDYGVIEEILRESGKGVCLDTPSEVACWLKDKWMEFCSKGCLSSNVNQKVLERINRKKNVEKLARILDEMIGLGK